MATRYDISHEGFWPHEDGDWVKYEDHKAEVERLRGNLELLKKEIRKQDHTYLMMVVNSM